MERVNHFTEGSLTYRRTRLLCPNGHQVQPVATVTGGSVAVLACGCNRGPSVAVSDGRVSLEHFSPFAPKSDQRLGSTLFPAAFDAEKTSQRRWGRPFDIA